MTKDKYLRLKLHSQESLEQCQGYVLDITDRGDPIHRYSGVVFPKSILGQEVVCKAIKRDDLDPVTSGELFGGIVAIGGEVPLWKPPKETDKFWSGWYVYDWMVDEILEELEY